MKHLIFIWYALIFVIVTGMVSCSGGDDNDDVSSSTSSKATVTGISLNQSTLGLKKGESATLVATISPSNAANKNVTWRSSDESAVSVSQGGVVTALAAGLSTVTAITEDGSYSASCFITVTVDVTSVTLSESSISLTEGETAVLTATIAPEDATTKDITWSTSDDSVVSVTQDGTITANHVGTAQITVTTDDQGHEALCEVTVTSAEDIQYNPYGEQQEW